MTTITRYRGDTASDIINVTDANGDAIDVTGYTFYLTVNTERNPTDDSNQLFQITGTIVGSPINTVFFTPSSVQADQTPGRYYYDIQMEDSSGRIKTLQKGTYKFLQDITKVS